jgi:hypothetical protein
MENKNEEKDALKGILLVSVLAALGLLFLMYINS